MKKEVTVVNLCTNFEAALIRQGLKEDSMKRYRAISVDFIAFARKQLYSQSLGIDFLINRLKSFEGLSLTDEHSRKEEYYCRFMRMLAEYYNFGLVLRRNDMKGEIIWPEGFRNCTEHFFSDIINNGISYGYVVNARKTIADLILYLDSADIRTPSEISTIHNDEFVMSYFWLSPKGIERKLCMLRRYYRFLFLNQYIAIPLAEKLPRASIQGRQKFPTVWNQEQLEQIKAKADRISPLGKRGYAMVMLAAELGIRIGDIRDLKLEDIDWA